MIGLDYSSTTITSRPPTTTQGPGKGTISGQRNRKWPGRDSHEAGRQAGLDNVLGRGKGWCVYCRRRRPAHREITSTASQFVRQACWNFSVCQQPLDAHHPNLSSSSSSTTIIGRLVGLCRSLAHLFGWTHIWTLPWSS